MVSIGGITEKRSNSERKPVPKRQRITKPYNGNRPIVEMLIHCNKKSHRIHVLLDTGCSVPLLAKELTQKLQIR